MFDIITYEFKKSYGLLFNKDNRNLTNASIALLLWCWVLRFILLYNTNEEAFKWGTNPTGHIFAVFSGLIAITVLAKLAGYVNITYREFRYESLAIMIFDAICLYLMGNIFIADVCIINLMYLVVDILKLCYFTYMTKLCFQTKSIQQVTS